MESQLAFLYYTFFHIFILNVQSVIGLYIVFNPTNQFNSFQDSNVPYFYMNNNNNEFS